MTTIHGHARLGVTSLTYSSWKSMLGRCRCSASHPNYALYAGRGIRVCDAWTGSFEQFLKDMGPRPSKKHSLDRIDSNGHYEPGNCRWATVREQLANRRNSQKIEFNGKTQTIGDWALELGIARPTLWHRLVVYKWPVERALTAPVRDWGR